MNRNNKTLTTVFVIFSFVGLIFFVIGGVIKTSSNKLKDSCTEVTTGSIIDYEYREQKNSDGDYDYYYYPVYRYKVDGYTFTQTSNVGTSNKPIKEGTDIDVHYNPDDNSECYIDSELKTTSILSTIFQIVGGTLLFISLSRFIVKILRLGVWALSKKS